MMWRIHTCGECVFWRRGAGEEGACFKQPPIPMMITELRMQMEAGQLRQVPTTAIKSAYPTMGAANPACGQFEAIAQPFDEKLLT